MQGLQARQDGKALTVQQLDKCTWQIDCQPGKTLALSYMVYALDASVRTAWLDTERGFFNGTSVCLKVHGQEGRPHRLQVINDGLPADWRARASTSVHGNLTVTVPVTFTEAALEQTLRSVAETRGLKAGALIHATRLALTGRTVSPGLFEMLRLLGRDEALARLDRLIGTL